MKRYRHLYRHYVDEPAAYAAAPPTTTNHRRRRARPRTIDWRYIDKIFKAIELQDTINIIEHYTIDIWPGIRMPCQLVAI